MTAETETKDAEAKRARLAEAWALRDAALASSMETWSADRIAAEVRNVRDSEER